MRVAELRDLLAAMPDDVVILVNHAHVEYAYRQHPRGGTGLGSAPHDCECGHRHTHYVPVEYDHPAALVLGSRRKTLGDHEPPVEFSGRWTKAMRAAIDAHSDDPDDAAEVRDNQQGVIHSDDGEAHDLGEARPKGDRRR